MKFLEAEERLGRFQADEIAMAEADLGINDVFTLFDREQRESVDWNAVLNSMIAQVAGGDLTIEEAEDEIRREAARFVRLMFEKRMKPKPVEKKEATLGEKKDLIQRLSTQGLSAAEIVNRTQIARSFVYEVRAEMRKRGELT